MSDMPGPVGDLARCLAGSFKLKLSIERQFLSAGLACPRQNQCSASIPEACLG